MATLSTLRWLRERLNGAPFTRGPSTRDSFGVVHYNPEAALRGLADFEGRDGASELEALRPALEARGVPSLRALTARAQTRKSDVIEVFDAAIAALEATEGTEEPQGPRGGRGSRGLPR